MCEGFCRRIINPTPRLEKMIKFLQVLLILNLMIPLLRILLKKYEDIITDLLCVLILYGAKESLHFLISGLYILIVIINNLVSFFFIGALLQAMIQGEKLENTALLFLCVNIFIFLFYSFAVIIVFPAHKEMKAIFFESRAAGANGDMEANLRNQHNNNNNVASNPNQDQQRNSSFVPFSGRGVQLG